MMEGMHSLEGGTGGGRGGGGGGDDINVASHSHASLGRGRTVLPLDEICGYVSNTAAKCYDFALRNVHSMT